VDQHGAGTPLPLGLAHDAVPAAWTPGIGAAEGNRMADPNPDLPPELSARLARPTVRLSGPIDGAAAAAFLSQVLPVLDVPGSIVVELFSPGGDAEVGRRLAQEVRLLRQVHDRDVWFLGKTLVASAAVTVMAAFPRDRRWPPGTPRF